MELKSQIAKAIQEGLQARGTGPRCGAGRAYVLLGKTDRKTLLAFQGAAKQVGLKYLPEAYGAGKRALYVGYDNFDGTAIAQSELIAEKLKAVGLPVYAEAVAD